MDDFIFDGTALREYGAHAFFGKTTVVSGGIKRAQYDTGGEEPLDLQEMRGSTFRRNVTIIPAQGVRASDEWQRRVINFLTRKRAMLILTREPTRARLAQFDNEIKFSRASWPHGALETVVTMGTGSYATREDVITFGAGEEAKRIYFDTGMPRPARITITPAQDSVIAGAVITAQGRSIALDGLKCAQMLQIDQVNECVSVTADGASAFDKVTKWERLEISNGTALNVQIAYAQGAAASVSVAVRGRWHA